MKEVYYIREMFIALNDTPTWEHTALSSIDTPNYMKCFSILLSYSTGTTLPLPLPLLFTFILQVNFHP